MATNVRTPNVTVRIIAALVVVTPVIAPLVIAALVIVIFFMLLYDFSVIVAGSVRAGRSPHEGAARNGVLRWTPVERQQDRR